MRYAYYIYKTADTTCVNDAHYPKMTKLDRFRLFSGCPVSVVSGKRYFTGRIGGWLIRVESYQCEQERVRG
jgi:hypothetical protein